MGDTLLAVDGNNLLVRSIKVCEGAARVALSSDGVSTGPLHIFINMLSKYVRLVEPTHVVVCFDGGHDRRTALLPSYKQHRPGHEAHRVDEPESAFDHAKRFLALANVHHVEQYGVEADDLIAAYWRMRAPDEKIIILSGDKDLLQLLGPNVEQIRPGCEPTPWTWIDIRDGLGMLPEQLPARNALMGDPSDGIPGVPGVGPKTAEKLLAAHGWDLLALLADEAVVSKKIGRMVDHHETVLRNLALIDLRDEDPEILLSPAPRFEPTRKLTVMGEELLKFLNDYKLTSIKERWLLDTLWIDSQSRIG